jgi:hypothetical protein
VSRLILEGDVGLGELRVGAAPAGASVFDVGDLQLKDITCA